MQHYTSAEIEDIDCDHQQTVYANNNEVCLDCGCIISTDVSNNFSTKVRNNTKSVSETTRCQSGPSATKSIAKDLQNKNLPEAIINTANKYYFQLIGNECKRGHKRRAIIGVCLAAAFSEEEEAKSLPEICKLTNARTKDLKEGLKMWYEQYPGTDVFYTSPEALVKSYAAQLGIEQSHIGKIKGMCNEIKNKSLMLENSKPQSVAASMIYVYLIMNPDVKNHLGITKPIFTSKVKLSENTIIKISKEIKRVMKLDISL